MSKQSEIRRATKALRHAKKRGASEYVVGRIKTHIKATEAGTYKPNVLRQERRRAQMPAQQQAERERWLKAKRPTVDAETSA